jgi:glycosyltransferase involved in cell wall biosynthesis
VERLREEESCKKAVFVFGTNNEEVELKAEIFRQYNVKNGEKVLQEIARLQIEASRSADIVMAVTPKEVAYFRKMTSGQVFLAPNGTNRPFYNQQAKINWKKLLPSKPWALYAGSAHPPNISGFYESFDGSLACLPPDRKIVLLGGMSQSIVDIMGKDNRKDINHSRLLPLGEVSDVDREAIKENAHGYILPVRTGSGSNLKAAEALYSGKPIVATPKAMIGFEQYIKARPVVVAETPKEFRSAVSELYLTKMNNPEKYNVLDELLWENCLRVATSAARKIVRN